MALGTLPGVNFLGTDKIFYQLFAFLRAAVSRPRLVHLQGLNVCLLLFLYKLLGMKVVVRYGSSDFEYQKWGLIEMGVSACARRQLKLADAVIAVSPRYKQRLPARTTRRDTAVMPRRVRRRRGDAESAQASWDRLGARIAPLRSWRSGGSRRTKAAASTLRRVPWKD